MYSTTGRPSIAPERLIRALLLQGLYTIRSERLLEADIARELFEAIIGQARVSGLLSDEHFSVDGTLIEAWASQKSFRPKDGSDDPPSGGSRNEARDFHGATRTNDTHGFVEGQSHRVGSARRWEAEYILSAIHSRSVRAEGMRSTNRLT